MNAKFTILIFLISILSTGNLLAQTDQCGTVESADPTFDILRFQAFKKRLQKESLSKTSIYIPIQAHIVKTSAGTGGLSELQLNEAIDTLNDVYAASGIVFFLCNGINYINSSVLFDYDANSESSYIFQYYNVNALNIYFFNSVVSTSGNSVCGFAHLPWGSNQLDDYVAMKNSCAINGSTLGHEIGHFFGLYHTHSTSLGAELVNGSNCGFSGDLCCDTPADPLLGTSNVSTSCVYTGSATDANGDFYNPDPSNMMSYARKSCRNYLSADQMSRVLYYQQNARNYLSCVALEDISLDTLILDTTIVYANDNLSIQVQQKYTGYRYSEDIPASNIGVYLSSDTIISQDDILLLQDSSSIGSNQPSATINANLTIPTYVQTADYYLIAWGDNSDEFTESDENNNLAYTSISIINDLSIQITVFPNPASDQLSYYIGNESIESIEILNSIGQVTDVITVFNGSINLSHLSVGSYMIRFINTEKESTVFHIIKQ